MELEFKERALLLDILPREGNIVTLRVVRELESAIGFTAEEIQDWEIRFEPPQIKWNGAKVKSKEIPVNETGLLIISKALKKMSEEGKLTKDHLSLYDKFVKED